MAHHHTHRRIRTRVRNPDYCADWCAAAVTRVIDLFNCSDNRIRMAALSASACCEFNWACCAAKRDWSASAWAADTVENERRRLRCLSNGAHIVGRGFDTLCARRVAGSNDRSFRTLKLPSALEADLVRSALDGEYATELAVPAPEDEFENPQQRIHTSCARRRSQLPLASSHSSRERTLARARAIEQSAAP